jgi:hypothetical protein
VTRKGWGLLLSTSTRFSPFEAARTRDAIAGEHDRYCRCPVGNPVKAFPWTCATPPTCSRLRSVGGGSVASGHKVVRTFLSAERAPRGRRSCPQPVPVEKPRPCDNHGTEVGFHVPRLHGRRATRTRCLCLENIESIDDIDKRADMLLIIQYIDDELSVRQRARAA